MSKLQRSVVLIKPDALQRGLVGEIISRFERKGLKLMGLKMLVLPDELLDQWYSHHKDKSFFGNLKSFMESAPVVVMLWEGLEAISVIRKLCGTTKGYEAEAGSIRGDYSISNSNNIIHASDSDEAAKKEEKLIFEKKDIFDYDKGDYLWVYSLKERQ